MKTNHTHSKTLLIIFLSWMLIGFSHLLSGYLDATKRNSEHVLSLEDFEYYFAAYLSWALFTFALYVLLTKLIERQTLRHILTVYLMGLVLWLPLFFVFDSQMGNRIYGLEPPAAFESLVSLSSQVIFFYVIVYSLTFGLCLAAIYYQFSKNIRLASSKLETQHAKLSLALSNMQMRELQSQLSPHFLFNSLNSISGLARDSEKEKVINAIARLGDLLRFTIEASKERLILLSSELAFLQNYIALQKIRFEERFSIDVVKRLQTEDLLCPPFLLQTLVENVFSHAVSRTRTPIEIKVSISSKDNKVEFIIENTKSEKVSETKGLNITMDNLKERLDMLFENKYTLVHNEIDSRYRVLVEIPQVRDNEND